VALLLLLGGVELNPGPTISARSTPRDALSLGVLNVRSARHKAALIHDVIDDYRLDGLALMETWIPSDVPDAVKLDVCPSGYQVLHRHRGTVTAIVSLLLCVRNIAQRVNSLRFIQLP